MFDGAAIENGAMDIKDLAPALLSLSELLDEASDILNPEGTKVSLYLRAIDKGSFIAELSIIQNIYQDFLKLFNSDDITALLAFAAALGIGVNGANGLFQLIQKIRNRKIKSVKENKDSIEVTIEMQDGDVIVVKKDAFVLFRRTSVRKKVARIIEPLKTKGIDIFKIINNDQVMVEVSKERADDFAAPDVGIEVISDRTTDAIVEIVSLSFKEGNKWRVWDGNATINVTITDKDFLTRVDESRVSFKKDDLLKVTMHTVQSSTPDGLKNEYEITKIIKHIKPGEDQYPLGV